MQRAGKANTSFHRTKSESSGLTFIDGPFSAPYYFISPWDSLYLYCSTAVLSISYRIQTDSGIVKLALNVAGHLL